MRVTFWPAPPNDGIVQELAQKMELPYPKFPVSGGFPLPSFNH
jgi:hypothetical protein